MTNSELQKCIFELFSNVFQKKVAFFLFLAYNYCNRAARNYFNSIGGQVGRCVCLTFLLFKEIINAAKKTINLFRTD